MHANLSAKNLAYECDYFSTDGVTNAWTCRVPCRLNTSEADTVCWRFTCTKTILVQISMWTLFTSERVPPQMMRMVHSLIVVMIFFLPPEDFNNLYQFNIVVHLNTFLLYLILMCNSRTVLFLVSLQLLSTSGGLHLLRALVIPSRWSLSTKPHPTILRSATKSKPHQQTVPLASHCWELASCR